MYRYRYVLRIARGRGKTPINHFSFTLSEAHPKGRDQLVQKVTINVSC